MQTGDQLLIVVRGDTVIILPHPNSFTKALGGLDKVGIKSDPFFPWSAPSHRRRHCGASHGVQSSNAGCLQAATAVAIAATAILTNDQSLIRLPHIEVGILDRLRSA